MKQCWCPHENLTDTNGLLKIVVWGRGNWGRGRVGWVGGPQTFTAEGVPARAIRVPPSPTRLSYLRPPIDSGLPGKHQWPCCALLRPDEAFFAPPTSLDKGLQGPQGDCPQYERHRWAPRPSFVFISRSREEVGRNGDIVEPRHQRQPALGAPPHRERVLQRGPQAPHSFLQEPCMAFAHSACNPASPHVQAVMPMQPASARRVSIFLW